MGEQYPMWNVYVSHDEPDYPPNLQRTGRRGGILVSVRAADELVALARGEAVATRKGYEACRGEWAVVRGAG